MGCTNLLVIVDHKPLTTIFGNRRLDEINNPRLFRLKRRTLMWKFDIEYQPGKQNLFADAASRHPNKHAELASAAMMSEDDCTEELTIAGVRNEIESFFAVTWEPVQAESRRDEMTRRLTRHIKTGFPLTEKELPNEIDGYWDIRTHLTVFQDVVLYKDRIIVPANLRGRIVSTLHSAHQGVSSMLSRAKTIVFWPGLTNDVEDARMRCRQCHRNAPSQAKLPPRETKLPTVPFEMIYADFFYLQGKQFLIIGDRLSGWTEVISVKPGTASSGARGLCEALRHVFATFGVPEELSSDGGPEFISQESIDFYERWGTRHRLSSSYFPQSNGRAEVAVKMTKRLLEDNITPDGSLNTDSVVQALLQQRNTPDKDCQLSPAEVLFGHTLRDALPQLDKSVMIHESSQIHNQWHQAWSAKEEAIRSRLVRSCERLEQNSKDLEPLREGESVFIQNQNTSSNKPKKWDRQGRVIATKDNDQYLIRVDGTGRLTLRNRKFLRKFQLRSPAITDEPPPIYRSLDAERDTTVPNPLQNLRRPTTQLPPQVSPPTDASDRVACSTDSDSPEPTTTPGVAPTLRQEASLERSATPQYAPPADHVAEPTFNYTPPPAPDADFNPRRSTRARKQRELYDASTGKSVTPVAAEE